MNLSFALLALNPEVYFPLVLVAKATLLLATTGGVALVLSHASAATRHLVWTLGLGGLLLLPLFSLVVPGWAVPILPTSLMNPVATTHRENPPVLPVPAVMEPEPAAALAATPTPLPVQAPHSGWQLPSLSWTTGLLAVWMMGVLLVLSRLALGWWGVRRLARRAQPVSSDEWTGLLRDLSWILDVNVPVRLLRSDRATMPMTWGTRKPVVLLPTDADAWPAERRRVVLLHELAHVARRDCSTQGFATFACALYWFHPGAWYAARRLRVEREQACDDRVLAAGTRAAEYAGHLLEVARRFRSVGLAGAAAVAMARPSQLEGRLLAVLNPVRNRWELGPRARLLAGVASLALIVPLAAMQAVSRPVQAGEIREEDPRPAFYPIGPTSDLLDGQQQLIQRRFAARPGQMLRLNLGTGGGVRVRGWDRDEVWVRAELAGRDWRDTRVEFVEYPDGLEVGSRHVGARLNPSNEHRFEVRVPRRFNVDVRSAGGGVALAEVQGKFSGETRGGAVSLTRVRGEARLSTGGGAIAIADSQLDGEVRTGGGPAAIQNTTGDVQVHSGSGGVVRGNRSLPASEVVRIHRESGDIDVRRAPAGAEVFTAGGAITIGSSGGAVRAQTGRGAIRVRSAVELVKLGTGGGAITVDAVDGGIAATTGAGAVVATMVGDPARGNRGVEIRSGSGAVVLTLPDGIGATFDIEAAYQGRDNNGRTGSPVRITSDFPLQQNEDAGSAGYRVHATGRAGDGRNRIFIRTVGDVRIRRAGGERPERRGSPESDWNGSGDLGRTVSGAVSEAMASVDIGRITAEATRAALSAVDIAGITSEALRKVEMTTRDTPRRAVVTQDSVLATVGSRDGATELLLTGKSIVFRFTEQGSRNIRNSVARSVSKRNRGSWMDEMVQASASAGVEGMRMAFPIEDVREARYTDGVLTLYMRGRPANAPAANRRGLFLYENVGLEEAQAFIVEFERVKTRR